MIRTCTVNKLLDSDSFIMSFTLKLDGSNDIHVVSGHIASCKDDGCNSATQLTQAYIFPSALFFLHIFVVGLFDWRHFTKEFALWNNLNFELFLSFFPVFFPNFVYFCKIEYFIVFFSNWINIRVLLVYHFFFSKFQKLIYSI